MDMTEIRRTRLRKLIDEHFGGVVLRLAERLQKKGYSEEVVEQRKRASSC